MGNLHAFGDRDKTGNQLNDHVKVIIERKHS